MTNVLVWPRCGISFASRDISDVGMDPHQPTKTQTPVFSFPRVKTLEEVFQWRKSRIMAPRPLLLDLYCGAGGASMGYYRAGFDVIGIDIAPQPNYPFPFIQDEAVSWLYDNWYLIRKDSFGRRMFDAVHASPPCQRWSKMSNCRKGLAAEYPDLIAPTRMLLAEYARDTPWVLENVPDAPLINTIRLCGFMFGRDLYRHRLFEASPGLQLWAPPHPRHTKPGSRAGHWTPGTVISVSGHCAPMAEARQQMDISWTNRAELAEAIPPFFTEHIGKQILAHLGLQTGLERVG